MSPYKKRVWLPTWKWWTATITAAGAVATVVLTGDGLNTDDEKALVIGLVVQRLVAYATPNTEAGSL